MKILVALSGGIDSSVTACLLHAQGHDLVGVRFRLWSDPLAPPLANILPSKCCNAQTEARALSIAKALGIPLHTLSMEDAFKEAVVDPFLEGYRKGLTPNPCIACNRLIKFGKLLECARDLGCEKLATGHYARIALEKLTNGSSRYILLEACDRSKDQSYYLYGLSQEQLRKVLFPLGTLTKEQVFALAEHFHVPFERSSYRESQDLCFFPEKSPKAFLRRYLKDALTPGEIVRRDGTILGQHSGLPLYTIGQRRIGIGGLRIAMEVVQKDYSKNRIIVAERGREKVLKLRLHSLHFLSWKPQEARSVPFECRVRSLSAKKKGILIYKGQNGTFSFSLPEPPQAPGQSLVLYRGEEVIGGGVIAS